MDRGRRVRRLLHVRRQLVHVEAAGAQQHRARRRRQRSPEAVERRGRRCRLPASSPARAAMATATSAPTSRASAHTRALDLAWPATATSGVRGRRWQRRHARAGANTSGHNCPAADRSAAPSGALPRRSTARAAAGLLRPSRGRWDRRRCRKSAPVRRRGHRASAPSAAQVTRSSECSTTRSRNSRQRLLVRKNGLSTMRFS